MIPLLLFGLGCGSTPVVTEAPRHDHADGGHHHADGMAEHMAAMAKTRDHLRSELGSAYDGPVAGLEGADPSHGKALFAVHCAACHGDAGAGDGPGGAGLSPPPADFTDRFHASYYADAGRVHIIHHGIPGTGMAGFDGRLSANDIVDVYAHVRTLRGD